MIEGLVGEYVDHATCNKCGTDLRNDHGYMLSDGTAICCRGDQCAMRVSQNKIVAQKAAGTWAPRWRKIN